jgi:transcriptional regulator with XRE-family HTH domain
MSFRSIKTQQIVPKNRKLGSMTIGERIADLREKKKFSKGKLAREAGTSTVQITTYERGDQIPGLKIASKIAKALEVTLHYLVEGEEMRPLEKLLPRALKLPKPVQTSIQKFITDQITLVEHQKTGKKTSEDLESLLKK